MTGPLLLDATAAASCPVKTQNAFSRLLVPPDHDPDPAAAQRMSRRRAHRQRLLDDWLRCVPDALDLRDHSGEPAEVRSALCLEALAAGRPLIVGATLPADPDGHRTGAPDVLLRGPDRADGRPGYHPVVVKWHRIVSRPMPANADQPSGVSDVEHVPRLHYGTLANPGPRSHPPLTGYGLRLGYRKRDFLQLAHYVRMLAAAGFAAPGRPWGGVLGTDAMPEELVDTSGPAGSLIAWADLAEPTIRTHSATDPRGWELRSVLDRYDEEHCFRLAIAESAHRQTGAPALDPPLLVGPIVNRECPNCPWWNTCRPQLPDDDLSLRLERGPLDPREIIALRRSGIATVPQLATADLDALLPDYLPHVRHRAGAEERVRAAFRRAGMMVAGKAFARETTGPITCPAAEVEVDFDLETATDGRIYLWGFRVQPGPEAPSTRPYTRQFSRFADLGEETEADLAREALSWLRELVHGPHRVLVFHYSGFEVAMLKALADRTGDSLLRWGAEYAEHEFVDLLEVIKTHYFGVSGLGLKSVAQHAGFRWRDADPGGLNSQVWFAEAVHGQDGQRQLARRRVLEYNEDDVAATGWLRGWLRAQ